MIVPLSRVERVFMDAARRLGKSYADLTTAEKQIVLLDATMTGAFFDPPKGIKYIMPQKPQSNAPAKQPFELMTPPYAFELLRPFLPSPSEGFTLYDPAAGRGFLMAAMHAHGYETGGGELRNDADVYDHTALFGLLDANGGGFDMNKQTSIDYIERGLFYQSVFPLWPPTLNAPPFAAKHKHAIERFLKTWAQATERIDYNTDFFDDEDEGGEVLIQVSNPQFDIKHEWVLRSLDLWERFALLLPAEYIFTQKFGALPQVNEFEIIIPRGRINFGTPDFGFTGGENAFMLPYWQHVRRGRWIGTPNEWKINEPKYMNAIPSSSFPAVWLTYGLNIGRQLTYVDVDRQPFFVTAGNPVAPPEIARHKRDREA